MRKPVLAFLLTWTAFTALGAGSIGLLGADLHASGDAPAARSAPRADEPVHAAPATPCDELAQRIAVAVCGQEPDARLSDLRRLRRAVEAR